MINISPKRRAETLTIKEFVKLTNNIIQLNKKNIKIKDI